MGAFSPLDCASYRDLFVSSWSSESGERAVQFKCRARANQNRFTKEQMAARTLKPSDSRRAREQVDSE
jgi:hypothetical protein